MASAMCPLFKSSKSKHGQLVIRHFDGINLFETCSIARPIVRSGLAVNSHIE